MLLQLLEPAGPELARRWVAALMLVPGDEREAVVRGVERRIVEEYGGSEPERQVRVRRGPVQREGYVEEVISTYEVKPGESSRRTGGSGGA